VTLDALRWAAVLGSRFRIEDLVAVTSSPVSSAVEALGPALEARIVEEGPDGLAFRHDLIQEAIYSDLPAPVRASMHVDAGRVFRSLARPAARVAEHMIRGLDLGVPELFDEAVEFAGQVRFASRRAVIPLYEKALELPGIPEDRRNRARQELILPLITVGRTDDADRIAKRVVTGRGDPTTEAMTLFSVLEGKMRTGRVAECIAPLERMATDPRIEDWPRHMIKCLLAVAHLRSGNGAAAGRIYPEVLTHAHATNDELLHVMARTVETVVKIAQGLPSEAVRLAGEVIEIDTRNRTPIPVIFTIPAMAWIEADLPAEARNACALGRRRDEEIGDVSHVAPYGSIESLICFLTGEWDDAVVHARTALEDVQEGNGSTDLLFGAYVSLGQILLRRGNISGAVRLLDGMERLVEERGPQWGAFPFAWTKALCLEAAGHAGEAEQVARSAWDEASSMRYFFSRPAFADLVRLALAYGTRERAEGITDAAEEAQRRAPDVASMLGVVLRCRGLLDDDADVLLASVDAYRRSPRSVERAGACEDAAVALTRGRRTDEARALFDEALELHQAVDASLDIRRVTAAMRQAGLRRGTRSKRHRPRTGWNALTSAERDIAALTVEGLTNPQIAERLFISKRTVQTHLSHVFAKLGISSRVALATIAAERLRGDQVDEH
jgi:ATP/maltotriose-dependent transcriptional regulator MalT